MTARHLTEEEIAKAQMLREKEGLTFKALGERFGLSGSAIQLILKKRAASPRGYAKSAKLG